MKYKQDEFSCAPSTESALRANVETVEQCYKMPHHFRDEKRAEIQRNSSEDGSTCSMKKQSEIKSSKRMFEKKQNFQSICKYVMLCFSNVVSVHKKP